MSWRMRSIAPSRSLLGLTLVLLLLGLLLSIVACEGLTAGSSAPTGTTAQSTTPTEADSAQAFFGSWQGDYTALEVHDQHGPVTDPPVPLNTPLEMHLVLHAWSEASEDCGTVTVAGYPGGRVTELSVEGQVVRLSIINEEEGLEGSRSQMTLTLEDDTLTGQDEPDPEVPEGWCVTSGTVYLTRTLSTPPDGTEAGGDGHSAESTEASSTGPSLEYMGVGPLPTTEREPRTFQLREDDNGHTVGMYVGDRLYIQLDERPILGLDLHTDAPSFDHPELLSDIDVRMDGQARTIECAAAAPGHVEIVVRWRYSNATIHSSWRIYLSITGQ